MIQVGNTLFSGFLEKQLFYRRIFNDFSLEESQEINEELPEKQEIKINIENNERQKTQQEWQDSKNTEENDVEIVKKNRREPGRSYKLKTSLKGRPLKIYQEAKNAVEKEYEDFISPLYVLKQGRCAWHDK